MILKFIRRRRHKPPSKSVNKLKQTMELGEHFLDIWDELVSNRNTAGADIEKFVVDLDNFVDRCESRWFGKQFDRLTEEHQEELTDLMHDLVDAHNVAVDYLNQMQKEEELREEVERLANPENSTGPYRSYEDWNDHPLEYSSSIMKKGSKLIVYR